MTFFVFLGGAAIVALVGFSFQVWGWSTEADNATLRLGTSAAAELRQLPISVAFYRREAAALKSNPPEEARRRFQAESEKAAAIIGRITEIERAASS
jgi:hypothetical protein